VPETCTSHGALTHWTQVPVYWLTSHVYQLTSFCASLRSLHIRIIPPDGSELCVVCMSVGQGGYQARPWIGLDHINRSKGPRAAYLEKAIKIHN